MTTIFLKSRQNFLIGTGAIVALVLVWWGLSAWAATPIFLPSPLVVFATLMRELSGGKIWIDMGASIARIGIGFVAALALGIPLGLLMGASKRCRAAIEPVNAIIRYTPAAAFIPISILWFGIGEAEKYFVIFMGVTPFILVMVADAVGSIPEEFLEISRTLGASRWQLYKNIIIPWSLPGIWDAMRVMVGFAWNFIILAEITAAESGLGFRLIQAQRFLKTPEVLSFMLVIGLLGLITDLGFQAFYRSFFPWAPKSRR